MVLGGRPPGRVGRRRISHSTLIVLLFGATTVGVEYFSPPALVGSDDYVISRHDVIQRPCPSHLSVRGNPGPPERAHLERKALVQVVLLPDLGEIHVQILA